MTGLKINDKKTQLLSISNAKNTNTAWIKLKDGSTMYSGENLKLLGFIFNQKPNVHSQVDNIIDRAASRSFVLRHLSNINCDKKKLRNVYCSIVRSVLEYSSVVYGPMLTKYQSNRIENIQKRCLRSIYGFKLGYDELLEESGLKTLEQRREEATLKFALKASKNPQFMHWFPLNLNRSTGRMSKTFEEKHASSDRLYNSPLFKMRRLLNNTPDSNTNTITNYSDPSHLFNAP